MDPAELLEQLQRYKDLEAKAVQELNESRAREDELAKQIKEYVNSEEDWYNKTGEAQQERDDSKKQLQMVEQEKTRLAKELKDLVGVHEKAAKENLALKTGEQKMKDSLETQQTKCEDLSMQLATSQRQVVDYRKDISHLRKELVQLRDQSDERQAMIDTFHSEADATVARLEELEMDAQTGKDAQSELDKVKREFQSMFDMENDATLDEYLIHIRNLQSGRLRRDASEVSPERAVTADHAVRSRQRQMSMADELQDFSSDDEEETTASERPTSVEITNVSGLSENHVVSRDDKKREDTSGESHDSSDTLPNHHGSTTRVSTITDASSPKSTNELESSYVEVADLEIDSSKQAPKPTTPYETKPQDGDLEDATLKEKESASTALPASGEPWTSRTYTNGSPKEPSDGEYLTLRQELKTAREGNAELTQRVEDLLTIQRMSLATDGKLPDEARVDLDKYVAIRQRSIALPWTLAFLFLAIAIYLGCVMQHEHAQAQWANDFGFHRSRRLQAPSRFQQVIESIIGYDRTLLG